MRILIFLFVLFPFYSFARCELQTRYGVPVEVCWIKEYKGFFSESCRNGCEARSFLDQPHEKPASIDRTGGKNPASQYCKSFGFKVVVLKSPRGSEQSYCEFFDRSLVDTNAFARALK